MQNWAVCVCMCVGVCGCVCIINPRSNSPWDQCSPFLWSAVPKFNTLSKSEVPVYGSFLKAHLLAVFIPRSVNICLLYCLSSRGKDALSGPAKSILKRKVIEHTILWWPFDRQVRKPRHQPHLSNHQDHKATKWWDWDLNPVLPLPAQVLPVIHLCALEETEPRLYQSVMYYTSSKYKRKGFTFCFDQWAFLFTNFQD